MLTPRIKLAAALLLAISFAALIVLVLRDSGGSAGPGLHTYVNAEHRYEITHPPGWHLTEHPTQCAEPSFCIQGTELRHVDDGEVYVWVNFQGGWCEPTPSSAGVPIEVSGEPGLEYLCPGFTIRSFEGTGSIIRYFPSVDGKNYFVLGQAKDDLAAVTAIVRSFAFTRDASKVSQPPPWHATPTRVPRPDETHAAPVDRAREELKQNASLARVIDAAESGDFAALIALAKKTEDYCAIFRELPQGCQSREDRVTAVFFDSGIVGPKPAYMVEGWLGQLYEANPARLGLAARDSRKPEGDGGTYYLVFRTERRASIGDGSIGGTTWVQGLVMVVEPGQQEPVQWFGFISPDANGLWWVQMQGGEDGAKHQVLITPQSVKDWPGAWGEMGD